MIDVFTKYALVKPLKDKNAETVFHGFVEIVNKSKCAPNKLWVDQGICPMQKWLDGNDILEYSTHNEGASVVT